MVQQVRRVLHQIPKNGPRQSEVIPPLWPGPLGRLPEGRIWRLQGWGCRCGQRHSCAWEWRARALAVGPGERHEVGGEAGRSGAGGSKREREQVLR
jgi:hypothetical protein